MERHEEDAHARSIAALCISMIIIPSIAVALRFWSRLLRTSRNTEVLERVGLWWDDWTAFACLPFIFIENALMLRWATMEVPSSAGSRMTSSEMEEGLRLFYVGNYLWNVANSIVRLAAVLLYARVFTMNNTRFKLAVRGAIWLVVLRAIIGIMGSGFLCLPASIAWDLTSDVTCGHGMDFLIAGQTIFVVIDIIVLLLPLPMVWKLRLSWKQRLLVGIAFLYGYCVPVISIGSLVAHVRVDGSLNQVVNFNNVTLLFWMLLEAPLGVTCTCLPPIFFLIKRQFPSLSRSSSSRLRSKNFDSTPSPHPDSLFDVEKVRSWPTDLDSTFWPKNPKMPLAPLTTSAPVARSSTPKRRKSLCELSWHAPKLPSSPFHRSRKSTEQTCSSSPTSSPTSTTPSNLRFPMSTRLADRNRPLPPLDLTSDLLQPAATGQPEYQTHIFTRRPEVAELDALGDDVIKVQREVNVQVSERDSERPLKEMLDTGLGLGRNRESWQNS